MPVGPRTDICTRQTAPSEVKAWTGWGSWDLPPEIKQNNIDEKMRLDKVALKVGVVCPITVISLRHTTRTTLLGGK